MSTLLILGAIVVAGIVAGVVAELMARAVLRRSGYFVWQRRYRRTLHLDRESHPQLEPEVQFEVNADGERGAECPRAAGTFRMLLVGGSTVESALNDQHTCWSGRLQALLSTPDACATLGARRVHVGNVGRSGLDVAAVGTILARTGPRYGGLDAIGVMVGPGDLMRWLESGAPADQLPGRIPATTCFAESPEQVFGWHPRTWAVTEVVRRLRMRLLRPVDVREQAARWMGRARRQRKEAKRIIAEMPASAHFLDRYEADLDATVARAAAHARTVILLRQPSFRKSAFTDEEQALFWNGGIGNAFRGDVQTEFYSTQVMYGLLDLMDERMQRVAARRGMPFVDPMPGLTMSAAAFFDHFHLTTQGADEVARSIATSLLALAARGAVRQGPLRDHASRA